MGACGCRQHAACRPRRIHAIRMCLRTVLCIPHPKLWVCTCYSPTHQNAVDGHAYGSGVGPLAIVDGRHPTLEAAMEGIFQANSTYLAETCSLHIITGPNMAGKSTYLRQVTDWTSQSLAEVYSVPGPSFQPAAVGRAAEMHCMCACMCVPACVCPPCILGQGCCASAQCVTAWQC